MDGREGGGRVTCIVTQEGRMGGQASVYMVVGTEEAIVLWRAQGRLAIAREWTEKP